MADYTYDDDVFSDLYKDIHGYRPRHHPYWTSLPAEKQVWWDQLLVQHEEHYREEEEREKEILASWEAQVSVIMDSFRLDRPTAIRWLLQAEGLEDEEDRDYCCYCMGLPYGTLKEV
jgi:hypothetical protein